VSEQPNPFPDWQENPEARLDAWCDEVPELRTAFDLLSKGSLSPAEASSYVSSFNQKYNKYKYLESSTGTTKQEVFFHSRNNNASFLIRRYDSGDFFIKTEFRSPTPTANEQQKTESPFEMPWLEGAYEPKDARRLAVDETYVGVEAQQISLAKLLSIGPLRTEAYFETASGNIYALIPRTEDNALALVNGRDNLAKGKNLRANLIPAMGNVRVGEKLQYGNGGETSIVTRIVLLDKRERSPDTLNTASKGVTSTIRSNFRALVGV
jgi:hypothetical protein